MNSLFSSTLDTVAPLRLRKIKEKSPTPWYNEHTRTLKRAARKMERSWRKTKLEVFRLAWRESTLSYRKALKTARSDYFSSLLEQNKHNPRYLFNTVAKLTNNKASTGVDISQQHSSNDFMNYFTSKIDTIRDQIVTTQPSAISSHQIVHYRSPEEQFHSFSTIGEEELYKLVNSSKPTTCMLDPIPSKLLKEVLPEVIDPLLAIIKNISKLRPMLSMSNAETLIHAFMTSRLDYCNALLGGCSSRLINKLQMVQNAAARVLTRTRKYDHISPVLSTLHWLPTKHRIGFKILLITYKAMNGLAPQYLSELLSHYSPSRPLHSQNSGHLIIPRISKSTAGGRSFSYLAPKLWNNLPNTVREADTLCQFKSRLKTHLFNLAYT